MKIKIPVLLLLATLNAFACFGQRIKVTHVTSATNATAPFYFLPKTAVTLEIPLKRVTETPGALRAYSVLVGLNPAEVITAKSTVYAVDYASLVVDSKAVFDKNFVYQINVKRRFLTKKSMGLEYLENGFLKGVDASAESNALPVITTVLSSAAKVVGSFVGTRAPGATAKTPLQSAEPLLLELQTVNGLLAVEEQKKKSAGYSKLTGAQQKQIDDKITELTTKKAALEKSLTELGLTEVKAGDLLQAVLLAKSVDDLRSKKSDLISCCNFHSDAETFQKMLDELNRQEEALLAPFAGTVEVKLIKQKFEVTAHSKNAVELFKYDAAHGFAVTRIDSLNTWNTSFDGAGTTPVTITFSNQSDHLTNITSATTANTKGFTYRLPGRGIITLAENTTTKVIRELSISQFGKVVSLPNKLSSAKLEYYTNGAISKLSLSSNSIDPAQIEKTGSTITDIHDQFKKKAPEPVDELAELERQRKILEEKVKIDELSKKVVSNP